MCRSSNNYSFPFSWLVRIGSTLVRFKLVMKCIRVSMVFQYCPNSNISDHIQSSPYGSGKKRVTKIEKLQFGRNIILRGLFNLSWRHVCLKRHIADAQCTLYPWIQEKCTKSLFAPSNILNSKGAGWLRNKKVSELTYVFFIFDNFLHL